MEDKIWNAVKEDSVGLRSYFDNNRDRYRWPVRLKGLLVSSTDVKLLDEVREAMNRGLDYKALRDVRSQRFG